MSETPPFPKLLTEQRKRTVTFLPITQTPRPAGWEYE